jgi:SAM-dependent methyltransferase
MHGSQHTINAPPEIAFSRGLQLRERNVESILIREMYFMQNDHWWFQGRSRIVAALIERFRPQGREGALRLCDIGCGTGANLKMLCGFGKVWGVEPDQDARELSSGLSDATIYPGGLPDELPFNQERFDVITLTDVLEHVEQDQASVKCCAKLLAPGGIIVATVPAYQWLWTRRDEHHRHYRRYTLPSFRKLFDEAGLEVELVSYCNSLLFPFMFTLRMADKIRKGGPKPEAALSLPWNPVNRALLSVFSAERHLLSLTRLPFGGSVVCVARAAPGL